MGPARVQEHTAALLGCGTDTISEIVKGYSDAIRDNNIRALDTVLVDSTVPANYFTKMARIITGRQVNFLVRNFGAENVNDYVERLVSKC